MENAENQGQASPSDSASSVEHDMSKLVAPPQHRRRRRRRGGFRIVRRIRRRLKRANWILVIVTLLGLLGTIILGALILVTNAQNQVENSWRGLNRDWTTTSNTPITELTLDDFARLQKRVQDFNASLAGARRKTVFLRPFEFLSADLQISLESLVAAQELTLAANDIMVGIQPTIFFVAGGEDSEALTPQFSSGARLVELLTLGQSRFQSAQRHLDAAQVQIDQINLANVSPEVLKTFDGLAQYYAQLAEINAVLLESPALLDRALGITEPRTYLILSQNSDELRPSGGYISTYGWLEVDRGRVTRYDYYPTTATSPNPPDADRADEVDIPVWWLPYNNPVYAAWDGSWTPDFPTTAQMAAWYYDEGNNPRAPVDGVIAIDLVGFEYVLGALGQVVVPGYNETVVPENFREVIYRIRAEGEGDVPHKQFLTALFRQIFDDWQQSDPAQAGDLRRALLRALQEKHIMIYMSDNGLNNALNVLGWSGEQAAGTATDYLMIVDSNLGNKSNRSVIRQLTYDVQIQDDGSLESRVAINYDYFARVAEQDPAVRPAHYNDIDYQNLLQVFVPVRSRLRDSNGFSGDLQTADSATHTEFVAYTSVDYDSSERYQVSYVTPPLVERFGPYRRYTLTLEKQPGTLDDFASVQVTLPAEATVVSTSPSTSATFEIDSPILEFRLQLITDETIEIIYRQ